jgi:hypothetical protein
MGAKLGDDITETRKHKDTTSRSSDDGDDEPEIPSRVSSDTDRKLGVKSWRKQVGDHKPGILLMAVKEGGSGSRLVGCPTVPPAWEGDEAGAWPLENQVDL